MAKNDRPPTPQTHLHSLPHRPAAEGAAMPAGHHQHGGEQALDFRWPAAEVCPDPVYNFNIKERQKSMEADLARLTRELEFGFNPKNVKRPF